MSGVCFLQVVKVEARKRSVGGHSRMTSRIGEKVKGGPNGREERKWRLGALAICHFGDGQIIIRKLGVSEAQLGLLQVAVGLVENNGKATPTDTELLPNFYAGCLELNCWWFFYPQQLTWLFSGECACGYMDIQRQSQ